MNMVIKVINFLRNQSTNFIKYMLFFSCWGLWFGDVLKGELIVRFIDYRIRITDLGCFEPIAFLLDYRCRRLCSY